VCFWVLALTGLFADISTEIACGLVLTRVSDRYAPFFLGNGACIADTGRRFELLRAGPAGSRSRCFLLGLEIEVNEKVVVLQ